MRPSWRGRTWSLQGKDLCACMCVCVCGVCVCMFMRMCMCDGWTKSGTYRTYIHTYIHTLTGVKKENRYQRGGRAWTRMLPIYILKIQIMKLTGWEAEKPGAQIIKFTDWEAEKPGFTD